MIVRSVLTGGVGSGKTTLLDKLRTIPGYSVFDEIAFDFVKKELHKTGGILPWTDPIKFCEMIVKERINQYKLAIDGICFYDRGIPDPISFLSLDGITPPAFLTNAATENIYNIIFWLPPWQQIYVNRPERPQSWEYANKLGNNLKMVYQELGYNVIEVPKLTIEDRVKFIVKEIKLYAL